MSWLARTATAVSWGGAVAKLRRTRDMALARCWLVSALSAMLVAGCLFPGPPEYRSPDQTPPHLWQPNPPTTEILLVKSNKTRPFTASVRSEDAGEDLLAFLYLNYLNGPSESLQRGVAIIPAGTMDDMSRQVSMNWTVPERPTPGTCEQLSMVVSHQSNFGPDNYPIKPEDIDVLTWWVDINDADQTLAQCPRSAGGTK
jgi:hypothetical protein